MLYICICKLWISECGGYTCDNEKKNNGWSVCYRNVDYHSAKYMMTVYLHNIQNYKIAKISF